MCAIDNQKNETRQLLFICCGERAKNEKEEVK